MLFETFRPRTLASCTLPLGLHCPARTIKRCPHKDMGNEAPLDAAYSAEPLVKCFRPACVNRDRVMKLVNFGQTG